MLPVIKLGAKVKSVDFELVNKPASNYALSGISKNQLIEEQINTRKELVSALKAKDEADFLASFTLNGEEIDEYLGYPHTLYNYLCDFVWHDQHHKSQMETFLNNNIAR